MGVVLAILGVICFLYGIAVLRVSSGTGFFMVWFVLAIALGFGAWAVLSGTWASLPPLLRDGSAALPVLALAAIVVACLHIGQHSHDAGKPNLDYIIVLGARVRADGPSIVLRHRLHTAADYLAANPQTRCITTGGQGPDEPESEAAAMKRYLVELGVPASRIVLENRSTTTRENLAFSRELIDPANATVGIVTNDFHMFRALAMARKQGLGDAVGIAAPSSRFFLPNNLLRESLAIAKALLKGEM